MFPSQSINQYVSIEFTEAINIIDIDGITKGTAAQAFAM